MFVTMKGVGKIFYLNIKYVDVDNINFDDNNN